MPLRKGKKPPIEFSGKLVYPTRVSMNHRTGRPDRNGTYGFLEPQHLGNQFVKEWIDVHRQMSKARNRAGQLHASEMIFRNMRAMAHESDYFMKPIIPRTRAIREKLKAAGIRVEEPIMDLKDGRELFARGENKPLSITLNGIHYSPLRDCRPVIAQITRMITRVHALNIVHGHPHINNFVVDNRGRVTMIDLGMARQYKHQPRSAKEFISRYGNDLQRVGFALAAILHDVPGTKWYHVEANALDTAGIMVERILRLHRKLGINTFHVTARELLLPAAKR